MEREQEIYCPNCSRRIKYNIDSCPYCEAKIEDVSKERLPKGNYPHRDEIPYHNKKFRVWLSISIFIVIGIIVAVFLLFFR
ncbi:MAG: hypothetical protein R6U35_00795 [Candidatus Humimicrobiaceae bacterium]